MFAGFKKARKQNVLIPAGFADRTISRENPFQGVTADSFLKSQKVGKTSKPKRPVPLHPGSLEEDDPRLLPPPPPKEKKGVKRKRSTPPDQF